MVGPGVVGQIGHAAHPDDAKMDAALAFSFRIFEAGYAACVKDVEAGATMGTLGDWLSDYHEREAKRKGKGPNG